MKSEIQNKVTKRHAGTRKKHTRFKKKKQQQQNKIKRSNTKLILVQAKLQYLPSIGADLSLKESLISGKERRRQLRLCENRVIQIAS